ncbi:TonB family protein [candidate division KSB1 bacterium]|nr:TonB family protein [candidate division KSB1 bacterium]NIR72774.1 TonB family protein [candidate division KSB1 bacterium]NIS23730.1 TonB family protein [candidate division KSB1 bacterium]NIT70650.1 TonB family protein [candidate division KSB1 bacterium]NIU24378.1 TonB family protein [candidate division KSB1 bacterium]
MKRTKIPQVDLKLKYRKTLELAVIFSLLIHFGLFHAMPDVDVSQREIKAVDVEIEVKDIPKTEHPKLPSRPALPSVPIPTLDEDVPEDVTIESTDLSLDLSEIPPPPAPEEGENDLEEGYVFVPYDEPPVPVGGMAAIQKHLKYPEMARKIGLEARVVVGVLVDQKGNPVKTEILKDSGVNVGFEEAAQAAVKAVKWKPALQRDVPVKVWVSVPIRFTLEDVEKPTT